MSLRGRQLFVGNLPFIVGWQDLKDLFRAAGVVQRANIMQGRDGRSKGHGLVLFATIEEANKGQSMFDGYEWHGRTLEVREDRSIVDYSVQPAPKGSRPMSVRVNNQDVDKLAQALDGKLTIEGEALSQEDSAAAPNGSQPAFADGEASVKKPTPPVVKAVFVGNLPFRIRWQDLKDLFRKAGNVVRADVALGPDERSKGHGTVQFATEQESIKAIEMFNNYQWQDRILRVQEDRSGISTEQRNRERPLSGFNQNGHHPHGHGVPYYRGLPDVGPNFIGRQIFVGNLPFKCESQDLKELFKSTGTVVRADIARNFEGSSRGFGAVLFATPDEARNAIATFDSQEYQGRVLKVHYDRFAPIHQGPPMHGNMGHMMLPHLPHRMHHALHHPSHGYHSNFHHQPPGLMPMGNHHLAHGGVPQGQFGMNPHPYPGHFSPSMLTHGPGAMGDHPSFSRLGGDETDQNAVEGLSQAGMGSSTLPDSEFDSHPAALGASAPLLAGGVSQVRVDSQASPYPFLVNLGPIAKPNVNGTGSTGQDSLTSDQQQHSSSSNTGENFSEAGLPNMNPYSNANTSIGANGGEDENQQVNGDGPDLQNGFSPRFYIYPNQHQQQYQQRHVYGHYPDHQYGHDQRHLAHPLPPVGTIGGGTMGNGRSYEWMPHGGLFAMGHPPQHMYGQQVYGQYNHEGHVSQEEGDFSEQQHF